jgi:glycerol-3-phosphate dehydrogenase
MRSACELGAQLALPATFTAAELGDDGVLVHYRDATGEQLCRARLLVNAAGPWVMEVARHISPAISLPRLELVQGTHIVLREPPTQGVYYVESPRDGRAVFVMPWRAHCLIGTTELPFRGDPASVAPSTRELHYLLGVARHYFPKLRDAAASGILDSFAGLRVLPGGHGHAFHRSRETLLLTDREARPRVLSICGGKLTTWRAVSAQALARVAASLPSRVPRARTDQLPLRAS